MKNLPVFLISLILLAARSNASIISVNTTGLLADYNNIQAAINAAVDGDIVRLADGTYTGPGNRDIYINKRITVCSANGPEHCIIDCQYLGRGFTFGSSCDSTSTLDGVTIIYGKAYMPPPYFTTRYGGAIYIDCSATITHCVLIYNHADFGGGIYVNYGVPTIRNCIIAKNEGDGIHSNNGGMLTNCTITDNWGTGLTGSGMLVKNCIIWGNQPNEMIISGASVSFSDIKGGCLGPTNKNVDPCFANPESGDYHLKSQAGRWNPQNMMWIKDVVTSLCIDAGWGYGADELWPNGKRANMGAYGNTPQASMSLSTVGNIADLNNDATDSVDFADFSILIDKWCSTGILMKEDISRDGRVDFVDVSIFAQHWLENK